MSLDGKLRGIPGYYSEVWVDNGLPSQNSTLAGGTTNSAIVVWPRVNSISGTDITYVPSLAAGDAFVINYDGIYSATLSMGFSSGGQFAITRNTPATELSGNPYSTGDQRTILAGMFRTTADTINNSVTYTGLLRAGDIIRCQSGITNNNNEESFRITRIA